MNNIKIFRARRGEGKTKWLVERAAEEYSQGFVPIYVGSGKDFNRVREFWLATIGASCPIQYIERCEYISFEKSCFLTDELFHNLFGVSFWSREILERGYKWYITMGKEDFVN